MILTQSFGSATNVPRGSVFGSMERHNRTGLSALESARHPKRVTDRFVQVNPEWIDRNTPGLDGPRNRRISSIAIVLAVRFVRPIKVT